MSNGAGLFDDLVDTKNPETDNANDSDSTDVAAEATDTTDEPARDTLTVNGLDDLPTGYVDVRGFAFALTQRNMKARADAGETPTVDDMVDTQAVYAATRGKRWSLPALDAVDNDGNKLGLVINLDEGIAAWEARPERGVGSAGAGMTPERRATRILRAGKAKAELAYWQKRVARYDTLLAQVGATWDDADEAYNQWLETQDAKKEIADKEAANNGDE